MIRRPLPRIRGTQGRKKKFAEVLNGLGWRRDADDAEVEKVRKSWERWVNGEEEGIEEQTAKADVDMKEGEAQAEGKTVKDADGDEVMEG